MVAFSDCQLSLNIALVSSKTWNKRIIVAKWRAKQEKENEKAVLSVSGLWNRANN